MVSGVSAPGLMEKHRLSGHSLTNTTASSPAKENKESHEDHRDCMPVNEVGALGLG